jgi:hypothetical protein
MYLQYQYFCARQHKVIYNDVRTNRAVLSTICRSYIRDVYHVFKSITLQKYRRYSFRNERTFLRSCQPGPDYHAGSRQRKRLGPLLGGTLMWLQYFCCEVHGMLKSALPAGGF